MLPQTPTATFPFRIAGIVHRDIKPANLMVTRDRRIKVTACRLDAAFVDVPRLAARLAREGFDGVMRLRRGEAHAARRLARRRRRGPVDAVDRAERRRRRCRRSPPPLPGSHLARVEALREARGLGSYLVGAVLVAPRFSEAALEVYLQTLSASRRTSLKAAMDLFTHREGHLVTKGGLCHVLLVEERPRLDA